MLSLDILTLSVIMGVFGGIGCLTFTGVICYSLGKKVGRLDKDGDSKPLIELPHMTVKLLDPITPTGEGEKTK